MTIALEPPTLDDIRAARARLGREVVHTPLVRLGIDGPAEIYLKLENLQPIGSFKLRGAANAVAPAGRAGRRSTGRAKPCRCSVRSGCAVRPTRGRRGATPRWRAACSPRAPATWP